MKIGEIVFELSVPKDESISDFIGTEFLHQKDFHIGTVSLVYDSEMVNISVLEHDMKSLLESEPLIKEIKRILGSVVKKNEYLFAGKIVKISFSQLQPIVFKIDNPSET